MAVDRGESVEPHGHAPGTSVALVDFLGLPEEEAVECLTIYV